MPDKRYQEQVDQKRMLLIRSMLSALPRSCSDFIRSLLTTSSILTRLAYTIDLNTFFTFAGKELATFADKNVSELTDDDIALLKARDIEMYSEYLTLYFKEEGSSDDQQQRMLKNQSYGVMRKLSSLRSYFNYLFRTERIPSNTAALVPLPKIHKKPILLLEPDEMHRLIDAVSTGDQLTARQQAYHKSVGVRDFAIIMLFLGTGIRVSECVGIDMQDMDFETNALLVTRKGGNQVIVYFPDETADALRAYLTERMEVEPLEGHENALFLSMQRRRITQRAVEKMVKKYAGIVVPLKKKLSPHKLRSTYATNLYRETQDIYLVAEALGHSDINTTRKHYASMSDKRMREAAANTKLMESDESDN
ncbi:MAG TPA: tyrosine-type recombinase/integrase [Candidatus Limiplasma sp.]|nr:tyrosine-type recombinase/integrase [Candidatus Limiplasma sp.]HRX09542.1 tyrosine-type recombinase/integrase [Candidatus Limiplasma sp.]